MSERCTCKWVGETVKTNATCPIHSIVCTKPLPDPCDEREPVNRCTCPDCALPSRGKCETPTCDKCKGSLTCSDDDCWCPDCAQPERQGEKAIGELVGDFRGIAADVREAIPPQDDMVAGLRELRNAEWLRWGRELIDRAIAALEARK